MALSNAGYRLALASNAVRSTVETALDCLELRKYFDVIYSNQEVERPKPHFEMYFKIMMDMNSKPSETLILEDSVVSRSDDVIFKLFWSISNKKLSKIKYD